MKMESAEATPSPLGCVPFAQRYGPHAIHRLPGHNLLEPDPPVPVRTSHSPGQGALGVHLGLYIRRNVDGRISYGILALPGTDNRNNGYGCRKQKADDDSRAHAQVDYTTGCVPPALVSDTRENRLRWFLPAGRESQEYVRGVQKTMAIQEVLTDVAAKQPENVLFATDWPICDFGSHLELVRSLPISRDARDLILQGNARHLLLEMNQR